MTCSGNRRARGFTLVELIVVMAMLGLVMGAIYTTYVANRKNASSQGEVVEVQQNLRVALDYLSRDIRMAGVLVPTGTTPIAAASGTPAFPTYSSNIMLNTASAEGRIARVATSHTVTGNPLSITLTMEEPPNDHAPNSVDGFTPGDRLRLIRPLDGSQPLSGTQTLVVSNVPGNPSRGSFSTPPTRPTITLSKTDGSAFADEGVLASDMIVKVVGDTYPMTVSYYLVQGGAVVNGFTCPASQRCLVRQVNGTGGPADIIATNISSLRFSYLDDGYHEARVPSTLSGTRAVRITLEGTTARTASLSGGGRVRAVTTVMKIRNRR